MTLTTSVSSADLVLRKIEAQAENIFLPIIGPQKGRYLAEEVRKPGLGVFLRWYLDWVLGDSDGERDAS
jgi:hypothetical protein